MVHPGQKSEKLRMQKVNYPVLYKFLFKDNTIMVYSTESDDKEDFQIPIFFPADTESIHILGYKSFQLQDAATAIVEKKRLSILHSNRNHRIYMRLWSKASKESSIHQSKWSWQVAKSFQLMTNRYAEEVYAILPRWQHRMPEFKIQMTKEWHSDSHRQAFCGE